MKLNINKKRLPSVVALAVSLALTGCGSSSDDASEVVDPVLCEDGSTAPCDSTDPASGDEYTFISSSSDVDIDLGATEVGEWSTSTVLSATTYDGLDAWSLDTGASSAESGNWGSVLAFTGGIEGDFSDYSTLNLKIATTGGYDSFAVTIIANGVASEVTIPVDDSSVEWQDVSVSLEQFALNLSSISTIAVYGIGGSYGSSTIYIADLGIAADKVINKDTVLESDYVFISSDASIASDLIVDGDNSSDLGNVIFGEWSTGTQISDVTYDGLSAVSLAAGGGWGAVLALQGDISDGSSIDNYDVDLEAYTNIKFKVAADGAFSSYALSIVSSVQGRDSSQEVGFTVEEVGQWNEIDINLEQYGVDLSQVNQMAIYGIFSDGISSGQTLYVTDFIAYDSGVQPTVGSSDDDKFVLLSSTGEDIDLRVDDNNYVNEGNITFSDWSTGSTLNGDDSYASVNAFSVTQGGGWGAVLAFMGDIYGDVQTWEIDASQYATFNLGIAASGSFTAYTVDFIASDAEHKVTINPSSSWTDISINLADIPLDLSKLTQIAIYGEGGNVGDKIYISDLNIAK